MSTVKELVEKFYPHAVEIRRHIHQNPELGYEEMKTTALIKSELASYGIEVQELPELKTGCTAIIRGGQPGKTVGLREDIDALPLTEISGLPFASTNGCAHACGHDMHTTTLLLTARVLQEMRGQLKGNVRLFFQPAEEKSDGSKVALDAGMADVEPRAEAAIGLHCSPEFDVGTIGVLKGAVNASSDKIIIDVVGKAGHGAHPERFVDPIVTAAYLITQLQTIISRENYPLHPAVLTFGSIHGGTVMNAVPASVHLEGTLRATDQKSRLKMIEAIHRIAKDCCEAMRCTAKVEASAENGVPVMFNDGDLIDRIKAAASETIGADKVIPIPLPSMGGEDFSRFGDYFPVAQFRLGTGNDTDPKTRMGIHNPANVFDERALMTGAAVMAQFVVDYLK